MESGNHKPTPKHAKHAKPESHLAAREDSGSATGHRPSSASRTGRQSWIWRGEFGSTGGKEGNTVWKMKPYMRPIILSGMGFILTVIVYVVIHWIWLPPEKPGLETITFIAYTNAPSGKRFALTAVTNHDAYPITFRDIFIPNEAGKDFSPKVRIHSTLAGKTLAPGDSCIALFDAPPYTNSWFVVCVATKHMLIQRIFGKYFSEDSFDDIYESQWFPKQ